MLSIVIKLYKPEGGPVVVEKWDIPCANLLVNAERQGVTEDLESEQKSVPRWVINEMI